MPLCVILLTPTQLIRQPYYILEAQKVGFVNVDPVTVGCMSFSYTLANKCDKPSREHPIGTS